MKRGAYYVTFCSNRAAAARNSAVDSWSARAVGRGATAVRPQPCRGIVRWFSGRISAGDKTMPRRGRGQRGIDAAEDNSKVPGDDIRKRIGHDVPG
jgi:hypothetical protein